MFNMISRPLQHWLKTNAAYTNFKMSAVTSNPASRPRTNVVHPNSKTLAAYQHPTTNIAYPRSKTTWI